jgi:YcxB-like protein
MQIQSTLTSAQIQEAARLARPRHFWLRFFAYSWYSTALCVVVLYADARAYLAHKPVPWNSTAGLLAFAGILYALRYSRWRNRLSKAVAARTGTASISLDTDGIRTRQQSGTTTFVPWSGFTKWSEGRNVFLLTRNDGKTILPVDESNRDSVRALLQGYVVSSDRVPARV